jgi:hypothetical protein
MVSTSPLQCLDLQPFVVNGDDCEFVEFSHRDLCVERWSMNKTQRKNWLGNLKNKFNLQHD